MSDLGKAYVQIVPSAEGIKGKIESVISGEASAAGTSAGNLLGGNLVSTISKVVAAAGIGKIIQSTLSAGGDLQQSFGGLDTIYGDASEAAKNYASEAAKAGISMNTYAEQAVSFGASLKQAFSGDTVKAAEAANTAILDMADNSAKMGTDIESVQNAYAGFAKQNYVMLDNLKLGYGGTKTEMERLLADATKLSGVEYNIDNLGDVYSAIHVIQQDLGLTGVAAAEAEGTFTGSMQAMKASAENLMANLALGNSIEGDIQSLIGNAQAFLIGNLLPMVANIAQQIPTIIGAVVSTGLQGIDFITSNADSIMAQGAELFNYLLSAISTELPKLLSTGSEMVGNLVNGFLTNLPELINMGTTAITSLLDSFLANLPQFLQVGANLILNLLQGIITNLPQIYLAIVNMIVQIVATIVSHLPEILKTGIEIIAQLRAGVIEAIPQIVSGMFEMWNSAKDTFLSVDWLSLGVDIINGIIEGLSNAAGTLLSAMQNLAGNAIGAIKGAFDINSPSRVMRDEVGYMLGAGVALGLNDSESLVDNAVNGLTGNAMNTIKSSLRYSPGTMASNNINSGLNSLASSLKGQNTSVNVTLQGDAAGIFRVVRTENNKFRKSTGYNPLTV